MRFRDKVVLVLGGNSGMGLAAAQAFAAEGATVHLTGRDQHTIDAAVASIPGGRGYRSDIADPGATDSVVRQIEMLRELGAKAKKPLPPGWQSPDLSEEPTPPALAPERKRLSQSAGELFEAARSG